MAKYTYFLDFGSGDVEFIPDEDAVYDWRVEGQNIGFKRKRIKGVSITRDYDNIGVLTNTTVYNLLWQYYFDVTKHAIEITINIYKDSVIDYSGVFYVTDGNIDVNLGNYYIKPITDDTYKTLLSVADEDVNILEPVGKYNANLFYESTYQEYVTSNPDLLPPPIASWEHDPSGLGTTYGRQKSLYTDNGQGTLLYQGYYYIPDINNEQPIAFSYTFPNCYLLTESIQYILDTILDGTGVSLTLQSQFFSNATNYVTGEVNTLMNTLIQQRSDTKDPDATNQADKGLISFNDMMADLRVLFRVHWYIDGTNLVIEHEKFFYNGLSKTSNKGDCVDLTDPAKYTDGATNELYITDCQDYETADIKKVKTETIVFEESETLDFRGDKFYLEYDTVVDVDSKVEHATQHISTDVGKAVNKPDSLSDDGFYLFNCDSFPGDTASIISKLEYNVGDPFYIGNGGFSVKWLLYDYYRYSRYNKTGLLVQPLASSTPDTYAVQSTTPVYIQKDIVFLLNDEDEIDINKYIATYLIKSDGLKYKIYGNIVAISHDLNDDFVTVTLGYEL